MLIFKPIYLQAFFKLPLTNFLDRCIRCMTGRDVRRFSAAGEVGSSEADERAELGERRRQVGRRTVDHEATTQLRSPGGCQGRQAPQPPPSAGI